MVGRSTYNFVGVNYCMPVYPLPTWNRCQVTEAGGWNLKGSDEDDWAETASQNRLVY